MIDNFIGNGDGSSWYDNANWSLGYAPAASGGPGGANGIDVVIAAAGANTLVVNTLPIYKNMIRYGAPPPGTTYVNNVERAGVDSLHVGSNVDLSLTDGQAVVFFSIYDDPTLTNPLGTSSNAGTIQFSHGVFISGGLNNSGLVVVELDNDYSANYPQSDAINASGTFSLTGGGTVSLEGDFAGLYGASGATIDNVDNLITGSGDIGGFDFNMGGSVALINSGVIDATGGLLVNAYAGQSNAGLIEATGTGNLTLVYGVENAGGTIAAFGSAAQVVLDSSDNYDSEYSALPGNTFSDIIGGTLATGAGGIIETTNYGSTTLDGVLNIGLVMAVDNSSAILRNSLGNDGTLVVAGLSSGASLIIATSTVAVTGTGTIALLEGNDSSVIKAATTATLVNDSNIIGAGVIGNGSSLALYNAGTIDATGNTFALTINVLDGFTNVGLLEDTGAQPLIIDAGIANTGGTIAAFGTAATVIVQNNAAIVGGTLTTGGGGAIETVFAQSGTLDGVLNKGLLLATARSQLHLRDSFTNDGTTAISGSYYFGEVIIDTPTVTLSGSGTIDLLDGGASQILTSGTTTLDNVSNLIEGSGRLGNGGSLGLINAGIIDANGTVDVLAISALLGVTNTGLLEATGPRALELDSNVANAGGTIAAFGSATAIVIQSSADVVGGTLTTSGGGAIETAFAQNATLDGVLNTGLLAATDRSQLHLRNTLTNQGTITVYGDDYGAQLSIDTPQLVVTGGGTFDLLDGGAFIVTAGTTTLDNVDNFIEGAGQIGSGGSLGLINSATIDANGTGAALTINALDGVINTGLLEATGTQALVIDDTVTNAGGTIAAFGLGAVVQLGAYVAAGKLVTAGGGQIQTVYASSATLDSVLSTGFIAVIDRSVLHLRNSLTNQGTITVEGNDYGAQLSIDSPVVTLTGGGTVDLLPGNGAAIVTSGTTTLDNVNNLIEGAGQIGNGGSLGLINSGIIDANGTGSALTINALDGVINSGLLESTGTQALVLDNNIANAGGTIGAFGSAASVIIQSGADIVGGRLATGGGGVISTGSATSGTLDGVLNTGLVTVPDRSVLHVRNTLTNQGTIAINTGDYSGQLMIDTPVVTLTGGGTVDLLGSNAFIVTPGTTTLDNIDNLIEGAGGIGNGVSLGLMNSGIIDANGTGAALTINALNGVINTGLFEATGTQALILDNNIANAGGTIGAFGSAAAVVIQSAVDIVGGTLATGGGGVISTGNAANGTFDSVLNTGMVVVSDNSQLHLRNSFDNTGTTTLAASQSNAAIDIDTPSVTLSGGGAIVLGGTGSDRVSFTASGQTLDNIGNLIIGSGAFAVAQGVVGVTLINGGTIDANTTSSLNLEFDTNSAIINNGVIESDIPLNGYVNIVISGRLTNSGTLLAMNGGGISNAGSYANALFAGQLTNDIDGVLTGGTYVALQGGAISGEGNLVVTDAADIILSGTNSDYFSGHTTSDVSPLVDTLGSIAPTGILSLLDGQDFAAANTLVDSGTIQLGAATLASPLLTLTPGGSLYGNGVVGGPVTDNAQVTAMAGLLAIQGKVDGSGVLQIASAATLALQEAVGAHDSVDFLAGGSLLLGTVGGFGGTIAGFGAADRIDLAGLAFDSAGTATLNPISDILTVREFASSTTLQLAQVNPLLNFHLSDDLAGGTVITDAACYCLGTRILTDRGERAVETLAIGDRVMTLSGAARPIKWIGQRSYDGRFIVGNRHVLPIRISAGALESKLPSRDLQVSPKHAMFLDGMLIPAELLVNGRTIVQLDEVATVVYFHIELDSHDVLLAEGAPSESFVDCDSRMMFQNAHEFAALYPADATPAWQFCAERVEDGDRLEAVRRRLAAQAGLATHHVADAATHGVLDGRFETGSYEAVSGWAYDATRPHMPVHLQIVLNGRLIGEVVANRYRADLEQAGLGAGRCAFRFVFPTPLDVAGDHALSIRRSFDQAEIPGCPRLLAAQPLHPGPLDGRLDSCRHDAIDGWAFDRSFPESPVLLDIMDGDTAIGRVLADRPRADLARAGFGQGRCAYLHRFAVPLSTDRVHHLWLRRVTDEVRLPGQQFRLDPVDVPRRRALFIDHAIPTPERDAGSQAALSHMSALTLLGYEVAFAAGPEPAMAGQAAPALTAIGVTWLGDHPIEEVLRREGPTLDLIYLHRFGPADFYGALARHHAPQARIVYGVADLHYLRLARQATVQGRADTMALSRRVRPLELMAAAAADAVITHSTSEAALLRQALPDARVHVVPWAITPRAALPRFEHRGGIAFIGSYAHAPNADAADWLIDEIMPLLWAVDPGMICYLVGTAPSDGSSGRDRRIVALGHLEELGDIFDRVRLTVAPLRFGAGVKGKVLDSLAAGLPCVCTSIAAEGIGLPDALLSHSGDTAADFAAAILRLHGDGAESDRIGTLGRRFIEERFSLERVLAALVPVVGPGVGAEGGRLSA